MAQTYRTNDGAKWGSGKGSDLTPVEVDVNFWDIIQRILSLEGAPAPSAGIASFSISGTQLTVHLTDATTLGPYTLPVATFNFRGTWQPNIPYSVMDTFTENGALYVVIFAHTSASTFDAGANNGLGQDYYRLMLDTPGNSLPTGGATGQVLTKSSGADFATTWSYKTPAGGTAGQVIVKQSSTQDNAAWETLQADDIHFTPVSGSTISSTNVADALEEISGDITTLDDTIGALTNTLHELSDVNVTEGGPIDGQFLKWNNSTGKWEAAIPVPVITDTIQFIIDGGGSPITTGLKGYLHIPFNCTIVEAVLLADVSGSIVVDIWKTSFASFSPGTHPVAADKITASTPPTISATFKSTNSTLTSWTTAVSNEDVLGFNVNSASTITRVTIALKVTR